MKIKIEHDKKNTTFVTRIEGKVAYLNYSVQEKGKVLDYQKTFVPPTLRGQHIGAELVKFALKYAEENAYKIIPTCSFVKKFIEDHPEYKKIVAY